MEYNLKKFEADIEAIQPRFVDVYVLPPFLMLAAYKAKGPLSRTARRILFTAGIYMFYRNYSRYKQALLKARDLVTAQLPKDEIHAVDQSDSTEPA